MAEYLVPGRLWPLPELIVKGLQAGLADRHLPQLLHYGRLDPSHLPTLQLHPNGETSDARKLLVTASLLSFLKVNLHKLHCFLLLSNLLCFLQLKNPLHNFFSSNLVKLDLDPDPHSEKLLDPYPHN